MTSNISSPTISIIAISEGSRSNETNYVNVLSASIRQYLHNSLQNALSDPSIAAIILVGSSNGKGVFSAGADIKEFAGNRLESFKSPDSLDGIMLNDLAKMIEMSPKPIVAALTGTCLGGGMELALSAQFRVADNTLRYGLPEIKIGLIPGAGGTQRLTRLSGVRHALDVIVKGRINCTTEEGLKVGFLDGMASDDESVLDCACRWAEWASNLPKNTLDTRRLCYRSVPPDVQGVTNCDLCNFTLQSIPPSDKGGESACAAVEAIRASFELSSFGEGIDVEEKIFKDLLQHSLQGRALRHVFFAERASSSSKLLNKSISASKLAKGKGYVGVIGAGTMGRGIAISFLRARFKPVKLIDINAECLKAGIQYIQSTLQGEASKGIINPSNVKEILSNLEFSTSLSSVSDCDMIVEAAFESIDVKCNIFDKLNTIVKKKNALLLTNTSTLDVDSIASKLSPGRRQYCAGMHFFSPAHIMKLVEVIKGAETSRDTLDTISAISKKIKKVPVTVGNCDGFVGNRMLYPYTTESTLLLTEYGGGAAGLTIADVDEALGKEHFGMAMGPFVMGDIAGNDIGYNIRREKGLVRDPETGKAGKNRSNSIRYTDMGDEMVENLGRVGQKASKGWYDYDFNVGKGRKPIPSSEMQQLINKYSESSSHRGIKLDAEEIIQRVLFPLVNEGFKILEEGIAFKPSDIDIIYLYGYGWPAWRGGPMFWADNFVGLPNLLSKLKTLHHLYPGSEYFCPSKLLIKCVSLKIGVEEYYRLGRKESTTTTVKSKL